MAPTIMLSIVKLRSSPCKQTKKIIVYFLLCLTSSFTGVLTYTLLADFLGKQRNFFYYNNNKKETLRKGYRE